MTGNLISQTPYSEVTATLEALGARGVTRENLTNVRRDSGLADRTARTILGAGTATKGVGKHIFGPEYWMDTYSDQGVSFSKTQLAKISRFPWSLQVLEKSDPWETDLLVLETHLVFLGLGKVGGKNLDLLRWREIRSGPKHPKMWLSIDWYTQKGQDFARRTCEFRWYLTRIECVPGSEGRDYSDQLAMLPGNYYNPSAAERVQANMHYRSLNGEYIDVKFWARCQDKTDGGFRVLVGVRPGVGVGVGGWNVVPGPNVRVAASRKILGLEP